MSAEENKALIRRYIDAIDSNDSSDWSILDEFIAEIDRLVEERTRAASEARPAD